MFGYLSLCAFSSHFAHSLVYMPATSSDSAGNSAETSNNALINETYPQSGQMYRVHPRTRLSDWCSDEQKEIIRRYLRDIRSWAEMAYYATRYPRREGATRETMEEITLNRVFHEQPRHSRRAREAVRRRYELLVEEIDNEGFGEIVISCNYNHPRAGCGAPGFPLIHSDSPRGGLILVGHIAVSFSDMCNIVETASNIYSYSSARVSGTPELTVILRLGFFFRS